MRHISSKHQTHLQTILRLAILLLILALAFPVLAGYTGPQNRTETFTTWSRQDCLYRATVTGSPGSCSLHLYFAPGSCPAASGLGGYFNNASTACGTSWPGDCGAGLSCNISLVGSATSGCSSGQSGCTSSTSSITHPPATVSGSAACASPGNNGWCLGGGSLSLSASEPWAPNYITGIESDAAGMLCSGPSCSWAFPEGHTTLLFWALSSHGDTSAQASATMKVDGTPPTVSLPVPAPDGLNGWHVSSVTVSAAASDSLSGVESVSINGGGNTFSASSDGTYSLNAVAYDLAGNSATASAAFQIDSTAPTLDVAVPAPDGSGGWYIHPPGLTASASDVLSGLAGIQYSLDGGGLAGGDQITVSTDGAHSVLFRAADQAGNTSSRTATVKLDTIPPALNLSAPAMPPSGWYSAPVNVSAGASDAASGVASAEVSSDGGASWAASDVLEDGAHSLNLRAADVAGNTATASAVVRVDTLPPVLDTAVLGTEGHNGWYTSPVTLLVDAADSLSGMAGVEYRIDGGAWQSGTTVNLAVNGSHTVELRATDLAGNTAGEAHTIMLDTSLPQLTLDAAGSFYPSKETLAIIYSVTASVSGVSGWALVVDDSLILAIGDGPDSGMFSWDGGDLVLGDHLLTLYAADEAGSDVAISQPIQLLGSSGPIPGPAADPDEGSVLDTFPIPAPSSLDELEPAPTDEGSPDEQPAPNPVTFIDNPPAEDAPALAVDGSAAGTTAPAAPFPDILWGAAAAATLAAATTYTLGQKEEEAPIQQAVAPAAAATVQTAGSNEPNWVYVQSPYIERVERVSKDVWLEKSVWVPEKRELIPGHVEYKTVTTIEYRPKKASGKAGAKESVRPGAAGRRPPLERVEVKKLVTYWVPPKEKITGGEYVLVREHPKWTVDVLHHRSIAVDCKDLPHWVAIRFFEMLDPHTPQSVQLAIFNRFRDGLAINTKANEGTAYQEALNVFFSGAKNGQYAPTTWMGGEYGGRAIFPDTFTYNNTQTGKPEYAEAWQYLNLYQAFPDLNPIERNKLDTEHYSLCGELAAMAIAGTGTRAGLHTFYDLSFGPEILDNIYEGTDPYQLSRFLDALGVKNYHGAFGGWATIPPFTPQKISSIVKNDGYMLALVNLDASTASPSYGKLVKKSTSTLEAPHWVTINGILPTLNGDPIVRVYNPFNNVEEYYPWSAFEPAWRKAGGNNGSYGYVVPNE